MKLRTLVTAAGLLALLSASLHAQAYKPTFSTQIKLAGNTTDPRDTITIKAPSLLSSDGGASWTMTLPNTAGTSGSVLATDGTGRLSWVSATMSGSEWNINGNTATSALTNFIGTTDATDFVMRTNNLERMRIKSAGTLNVAAFSTAGIIHNLTGGDLASSLLVNADVSATAAITGTKIVPNFGNQTILTGDATHAGTLSLYDANNHMGTIVAAPNLGVARNDTLPNKSGTFAMLSDLTNGGNINVMFDTLTLGSLTTGGLVQSAQSTGLISNGNLSGDVLTSGTLVTTINNTTATGNHIVAALNSPATAKSLNAGVLNYDTTLLVHSNQLGLDLTHTNTWTSLQRFTGGITASGTETINSTGSSPVNIGAGGTYTGTITVGDSAPGNVSTTYLNGNVIFSGPVTFPAGSVTPTVLGLQTNYFFVGDGSNHAAAVPMYGDANLTYNVTNGGVIAITTAAGPHIVSAMNSTGAANSLNANVLKYDTTLLVHSNQLGLDLTHTNTWTGLEKFNAGLTTSSLTSTGTATFGASPATAGSLVVYDANNNAATIKAKSNLTGAQSDTLPAKSGTFAMLSDLTNGSNINVYFDTLTLSSLTNGGLVQSQAGTGKISNGNLSGDVATSGSLVSTIQTTAGPTIVSALNTSGAAASLNGNVLKYDSTLQVNTGNHQLGTNLAQANVWTGMQAFGPLGLTQNGTVNFSGDVVTLQVNPNYSYFFMANASAVTGNVNGLGFTSGTPTAGRMVILVNSGTNPITFVHMSGTAAPGTQFDMGGNVIVDASGSVTLLYDGAAWHMLAAQ